MQYGPHQPYDMELVDPPRLEPSTWRDSLERAAKKRDFAVHWWKWEIGDWITLRVEVRNLEGSVVKRAGLTKLAPHFDEALVAEGVAEWLMNPQDYGVQSLTA